MVCQGEQEKADETKDRPWQYGKDTPYYSEKDKNGPTDNRNGLEQGLSASIYFLTSSISTKMSTSSPTTTPPVSSTLFHVRPKSLRLIFAVPVAPRLKFPQGSLTSWVGPPAFQVSARVTPCIVRSPVTFNRSGPSFVTFFETKLMVGYLATSKKSAALRCSSLLAWPVFTEAASMVSSTFKLEISLSSIVTAPFALVKSPFTLETMRWRTLNWKLECS